MSREGPVPPFRAGFAVLAGWTNVGKSTLLNRLVGENLAAVGDAPQTTRHRIVGAFTVPGRGQIALVDTPGVHRARERMNRAMVNAARRALAEADVTAVVLDSHRGLGDGDADVARAARASGRPTIAVLNKIDLLRSKTALLPLMETVVTSWGLDEAVPVSARTGEGCDLLTERLLARLPETGPLFPEEFLTDQPERVLVAERVREKIVRRTRQEIPHATAVVVERWTERDDGLVSIEASVLVERDSQKAIVIGKAGGLLKQVGEEARREIENLLGARVYLALRVEVVADWRNDPRTLRRLGLA